MPARGSDAPNLSPEPTLSLPPWPAKRRDTPGAARKLPGIADGRAEMKAFQSPTVRLEARRMAHAGPPGQRAGANRGRMQLQ